MFWKKGPKTARGMYNKMMTGDGRKNPAKEIERMLFGDNKRRKKGSKKGDKGFLF